MSIGFHAAHSGLYTAPMEEDAQALAVTRAQSADAAGLEALLAAVADRDEAAFAAFYDATSARAYALILRITQMATLAEEVMSDVYLQVWQQAQRFDAARGNAQAWLFMLCRSRALDHLRRREPAETHADPDGLRNEAVSDASPLDLLLALDRTTAIHAAVAQLGEVERQLLALAFFRGLSHQEIADQTGMPLGTVKTVLRKSLHTLKDRLVQFAPAPEGLS
ncbi:MAG: sigma-70 family RNA polymerase sigma factor [Gammaproteobacteria bacterium]|nr:sigma-70 family RNA polymerase sigma factor [Gammaproteobacteria bacterium]